MNFINKINMINKVIQGDCLEVMKDIPDKSIDMILADLPYGTTACKWDTIIPFEPLWEQYKRIIKDNGAIVLTASQPFTSALVMSNVKMFKYEWIWDKVKGTGFQIAKFRPMIRTESVLVFGKGKVKYNPQKIKLDKPKKESLASTKSGSSPIAYLNKGTKLVIDRHPTNIIQIKRDTDRVHPTQKPVALYKKIIEVSTDPGAFVFDPYVGSAASAIACMELGREFLGYEIDREFYSRAQRRVQDCLKKI